MEFAQAPPAGYELQSTDSTYWAEKLQFDHWRSLDMPGRVRLIEDWNVAIEDLQLEGVLRDHPDATAIELRRFAAEARYGPEFVERFLGYAQPANLAR
jgi:hypothetical protein